MTTSDTTTPMQTNNSNNSNPILYGQVVVGPPGAGKTTYCAGMQQYLRLLQRNAWVMNMDPANAETADTYECIFDVCQDMVTVDAVMNEFELGPNGALLYCMEYMEQHCTEIVHQVRARNNNQQQQNNLYLLLDFPGQVELYTHSTCVQQLLFKLQQQLNLRLTLVQLMDSHSCCQAATFISATLLATTTLLRMELPAVTVWTKMDLLLQHNNNNELNMPWEFYEQCHDVERILPFLDHHNNNNDDDDLWDDVDYQAARQRRKQSTWFQKYTKLHQVMAEVVQDFGLLGFVPLDIQDATMVGRVLAKVDQCNGYVYTQQHAANIPDDLFQCAAAAADSTGEDHLQIRERMTSSARTYNQDE